MEIPDPRGGRWLKRRGACLIETLLVLLLVSVIYVPAYCAVLKEWRKKLETLQEKRLRYDGVHPFEAGEK